MGAPFISHSPRPSREKPRISGSQYFLEMQANNTQFVKKKCNTSQSKWVQISEKRKNLTFENCAWRRCRLLHFSTPKVHKEFTPVGQTVTAKVYKSILDPTFEKNLMRSSGFLCDKIDLYCTIMWHSVFSGKNVITILQDAVYSLDLTPVDYFVFPK